ncbi:tRNA N(3)-methylcytidine methyltransferase Mettl2 isoform X2 [Euwallacea similis]|uniref:tRNA N(3)-methylcytidine methyltransferase Mettl2 isoform X2 n=1 Tax=Euwallacea similis TaxID=1736056 RepID=UPI00344CB536
MNGMESTETADRNSDGDQVTIMSQFGNRYLTEEKDVFQHNAWDDVQWDDAQEQEALKKVQENGVIKFSSEDLEKYENDADKFWDAFYEVHDNKFFKDRHWLFTEFPELTTTDNKKLTVFELGCGVGNTIFPILQYSTNESLKVYGCDFSEKAIQILKDSEIYDSKQCCVFILDVSKEEWNLPFEENSIDVIVVIFVLSAIHPDRYKSIVHNIHKCLKPGGLVLFRDYGRYDLAQLRFKPGRSLGDNFYVRGDGTRVYFFTQEEIKLLFEGAGFIERENRADRRLQVNRGRLLKMYRVWIQAKYEKPK